MATPSAAWADTTPTPTPTTSAEPTPLDDGTISVQAAPASNGLVTPGAPFSVVVQVTNGTTTTLGAGAVEVELSRTALADDEAYAGWISGTESTAQATAIGSAAMPAVAPGSTHSVTVQIDPAAFGLSAWGAYGIAADVTVGGEEKAETRSAIVWNQGAAPASEPVTLVAPITVPASTTALISSDDLETWTASDGLLTEQLDAFADRPVVLAIDPRIIASIRALGTTAPPTATEWLGRLEKASNETFPLQYGDADLSAQAQTGQPSAFVPTSFEWALDAKDFPSGTVPTTEELLAWDWTATGVAWPREGTVASGDLTFYRQSGLSIPLLGSSQLSDAEGEVAAATARVGDEAVLVSDSEASRAAQGAIADTDDVTRGQAIAELSASLAVDAQATGPSERGTLVVLDRTSTDPVSTDRLLSALETAPWAGTAPLDGLLSSLQSAASEATLTDSPESADRIDQVRLTVGQLPALERFSTILDRPQLITGRASAAAMTVMSNAWALRPEGFASAVADYVSSVSDTLSSVQIVDGSSITMVSNDSDLPLTVANDLPYPVTVVIHAVPSNGRLVVGQTDTPVTLEAESRKSVKIPLQAQVASGQVLLRLQLQAPDGSILSSSPPRQVTVSADWETAGTAIAAGLVVVLFAIGITREVIKRRRRRASTDPDEILPDDGRAEGSS